MPQALESATDEELVRLYVSGDEAAFREIYGRHSSRVYSYLFKRLNRRQDADELHQAVFLKFHQVRHRYDPQYSVLQWLFVISKTALLDFHRKQKRAVLVDDDVSAEEVAAVPNPEASNVEAPEWKNLESLSEEQRKVVEWRYLDSLSYEEISARLGKSPVSTRQILSRAVKKLRSALAGPAKETVRKGNRGA